MLLTSDEGRMQAAVNVGIVILQANELHKPLTFGHLGNRPF